MNLPNANLAIVDREKITEYLLNAAHPDNGGKAAFFAGFGFTHRDWKTFGTLCVISRHSRQLSVVWNRFTVSSILLTVRSKRLERRVRLCGQFGSLIWEA